MLGSLIGIVRFEHYGFGDLYRDVVSGRDKRSTATTVISGGKSEMEMMERSKVMLEANFMTSKVILI